MTNITHDTLRKFSLCLGLNIFFYWVFCNMKSPRDMWDFYFDINLLVILLSFNMIGIPAYKFISSLE